MTKFTAETSMAHLDQILRALCEGVEAEKLINDFVDGCESLTRDQVSTVFIELENNGYNFQDNPGISNFYHEVIEDKVAKGIIKQFEPGHPVAVYLEENRLLQSLFRQILKLDPQEDETQFRIIFEKIRKVELHYVRKENQLFPCLEKHGWDSPSKSMWSLHDDIRASIKEVNIAFNERHFDIVNKKTATPHWSNG